MRTAAAIALVFWSGFAVMVLEIVGARLLAKDFGSSFYVWVSQIGVILVALALGYWVGGILADRYRKVSFLSVLLLPAGLATLLIPRVAGSINEWIIDRHPLNVPIPALWRKLDPALGSAAIFLLPCFVLAAIPPYMIRLAATRLAHVGRVSGLVYSGSTVGSIAGVFVSGYVLIDSMNLSTIFQATGGLILLIGVGCLFLNRWFADPSELPAQATMPPEQKQ